MRKTKFQTGEYYHIYNRGVDKRLVFQDDRDYLRFLRSIREFNQINPIESLYRQDQIQRKEQKEAKPLRFENRSGLASPSSLVEIVCHCLIPNHFHLLLKQRKEKGIEKFIHKVSTGYTRYFNERYNRSGALYQGTYKAIKIKSDEQLIYVSAYINGNVQIHKIAKAAEWPWSSYQDYLSKRSSFLCRKSVIIEQFKDIKDYKSYADIVIKDSSSRKDEIRRYLLEE